MDDGDDERQAKRPRLTRKATQRITTTDDVIDAVATIWKQDKLLEKQGRQLLVEFNRDMREFFGCSPKDIVDLWDLLIETNYLPEGGRVDHLLWTLMWMKIYARRKILCLLCGNISKDTLKKWVEAFLDAIANTESPVIIWENRYKKDRGCDCLVTVDGVDCRCPNLGPKYSSHKFAKKGGLRYEVAVCIQTGDIVWINGPFPAGRNPDITIFRSVLMSELEDGERVEADDGYIGEAPMFVKCPKSFPNPEETLFMQQRVRNRQETANKHLKDWQALEQA